MSKSHHTHTHTHTVKSSYLKPNSSGAEKTSAKLTLTNTYTNTLTHTLMTKY